MDQTAPSTSKPYRPSTCKLRYIISAYIASDLSTQLLAASNGYITILHSFCKQYTYLFKEFKFYVFYGEMDTNINRFKLSNTMSMLYK